MSTNILNLDPAVQLFHRPLLGYLYYLTHDSDLAGELSQHTWLRAAEHASADREPATMRPWLFTIARHLVVDAHRARKRTVPLDPLPEEEGPVAPSLKSAAPSPFDLLAAAEEGSLVREAVRLLPARLRAVCVLHYFGGLTLAEVAGRTRLPVGTIRSRLHRALGTLRRALAQQLMRPGSRGRRRHKSH